MDFSYGREVSEIVNTGEKNLFAGSDTIVLGKYSPGAGTIRADISANTRTGNRSFSKEFSVIPKAANSFIQALGLYNYKSLLDRIEVEGENEALVSEVTGLALEFGFVTPYTSLFVELPELANPETIDSVSEEVMEMPAEGEALMDGAMSTPSAGQPKPAASSPYDRNAVYEGAMAEEPVEEAEEAATPGFEVSLALSGLLGIAFCFRKR